MGAYNIFFKASVEKDLNLIPKEDLKTILHRIEMLSENQRPSGCEKLTGRERYRVREGLYRIAYSFQDEQLTVWVVKVGHRKHIYR